MPRSGAADAVSFQRSVYALAPVFAAPGTRTINLERRLEDTGLNRILGDRGDDELYGGTGLDFLFGNGGNDTLFRADGTKFENLDGGLAGDAWKEYAKATNQVWYVGGSGADDVISVDFVTEPGLLQGRHLVTRLTNNNGNFTFAAQLALDFDAVGEDGEPIWDAEDAVLELSQLRSNRLADRSETLSTLPMRRIDLLRELLPPEGEFQVIIVDALGGNDQVTIGPTVQKTVWVDAGDGDDRVEILAGNAILVDKTEGNSLVARNDLPENAYTLAAPASLVGTVAAPADGRLSARARLVLRVDGTRELELVVDPTATEFNATLAALVEDLNDALRALGADAEVVASRLGDRVVLSRTRLGYRCLAARS